MRSRGHNQQQGGPRGRRARKRTKRGKKNWPTRLAGSRRQTSKAEIERKRSAKAQGKACVQRHAQRAPTRNATIIRRAMQASAAHSRQSETENDGERSNPGGEKRFRRAKEILPHAANTTLKRQQTMRRVTIRLCEVLISKVVLWELLQALLFIF
jgi:hypothetical protein